MMKMHKTLKGIGAAAALLLASVTSFGAVSASAQASGYFPSFHGASAGFTDMTSLGANGNDGTTSSVLLGLHDQVEPGLVTYDPRTGLFTHVELDVTPNSGGQVSGMATITVLDANGNQYEQRVVPARGAIRFRESWRRNYQPGLDEESLGLDGILLRRIGHGVRIQASGPERAAANVRGTTRFDTSSRFSIAPFTANLQTRVARVGQPTIAGRSVVVMSGLEDEAFFFEVNESNFASSATAGTNAWSPSTLLYSPFAARDEAGVIVPVVAESRVHARFYNQARNAPGRYQFNYRGSQDRAAFRLRQAGHLLAVQSDEGANAVAGNIGPFVGTMFDTGFNASSRSANTRIVSNRDRSLLLRD